MTPVRLRLSRAKGFDLQALSLATNGLPAVNVARPSPLGNPYVIGEDGTRQYCVGAFIMFLDGYLCTTGRFSIADQNKYFANLKKKSLQIRGKNLACWCKLPQQGEPDLCHAAVLLTWANIDTPTERKAALRPIMDAVFNRPICEPV